MSAARGELNLSECLARYRGHEAVAVIASTGRATKAQTRQYVCGICGFALTEPGECPRCKMQVDETARRLRARRRREELLSEIDQVVEESWEDSGEADDP